MDSCLTRGMIAKVVFLPCSLSQTSPHVASLRQLLFRKAVGFFVYMRLKFPMGKMKKSRVKLLFISKVVVLVCPSDV